MDRSRRQFLRAAAAGLALPVTGAAEAVARILPTGTYAAPALPTVVDLASDSTPILAALQARGVKTICRYYALRPEPERGLPDKIISPSEATAIFDAGFSLAMVFQYYSHLLANMNPARGRRDAETALEYATARIDQPAGSAIYFAVDNNWHTPAELARVQSYFEAVNEVFAAAGHLYRIGVYGAGRTCRFLREKKLAELFWLAKSTCWSETVDCYNDADWHLYQSKHNIPVNRILIDTDLVNPLHADFGQFRHDEVPVEHDEAHSRRVMAQLSFITSSTGIYRRPGSGRYAGKAARLSVADTVRVLGRDGDWLLVDIDEDGSAEGYIPAAAVTGSQRMPRRC